MRTSIPGQVLLVPTPAPINELLLDGKTAVIILNQSPRSVGLASRKPNPREGCSLEEVYEGTWRNGALSYKTVPRETGLHFRRLGRSTRGLSPVALYTTGGTSRVLGGHGIRHDAVTERAVVGLGVLDHYIRPSQREVLDLLAQIHGHYVPNHEAPAWLFYESACLLRITDLRRLAIPIPLSSLREDNPGLNLRRLQMVDGGLFKGAATYAAGSHELGTHGAGTI